MPRAQPVNEIFDWVVRCGEDHDLPAQHQKSGGAVLGVKNSPLSSLTDTKRTCTAEVHGLTFRKWPLNVPDAVDAPVMSPSSDMEM